jgi:hypothetical protein
MAAAQVKLAQEDGELALRRWSMRHSSALAATSRTRRPHLPLDPPGPPPEWAGMNFGWSARVWSRALTPHKIPNEGSLCPRPISSSA